jgi:C_GCAxxG_C_C family probable redox protein
MQKPEKAIEYFEQGFNCSQSVLIAFRDELKMPADELLKISCAFGGGMGRRQLACGAVSGALMVLGLHYGRGENDDISHKITTYEKAEEFMRAFELLNGSVNCRELLQGLNMKDPEDMKKIAEMNLFKTSCYKYATDAVEIVQKMLNSNQ